MIDKKIADALNAQIREELSSAYIYLAMAADFAAKNLGGFAHWMRIQAKEETGHAMKIYSFLVERGSKPVLDAIPKPQESWASPLAAFEAAYKHERHISSCIDRLFGLARESGDPASEVFLQWFVNEQVEEEAHADEIVQKLKLAGDSGSTLLVLDGMMAGRSAD